MKVAYFKKKAIYSSTFCCKGCIFCRSRRNWGLLSESKWMQKNKKIISETTELTTWIFSFFIQTTLHNSSKNASHHSSWETEPNSAGFHSSVLSHNCLIFLSNSISQDKLEQMYLTFSHCKGLSRFQAHIPEEWYFSFTPSSWLWQEVSFPERSPHGTGFMPGWLQKRFPKARNSNGARSHNRVPWRAVPNDDGDFCIWWYLIPF